MRGNDVERRAVAAVAVAAYVLLATGVAAVSFMVLYGREVGRSALDYLVEWWTTALLPPALFAVFMGFTGVMAFCLARRGHPAVSAVVGAAGAYAACAIAYLTLAHAQGETPGGDLGMLAVSIVIFVPLGPTFLYAAVAPAMAARAWPEE